MERAEAPPQPPVRAAAPAAPDAPLAPIVDGIGGPDVVLRPDTGALSSSVLGGGPTELPLLLSASTHSAAAGAAADGDGVNANGNGDGVAGRGPVRDSVRDGDGNGNVGMHSKQQQQQNGQGEPPPPPRDRDQQAERATPRQLPAENEDAVPGPVLYDAKPADLASFAELIARFEARVDKAAAGRKHRALRTAWDDALAVVGRYADKVDLVGVAEHVVVALRTGCESTKVAVVDACLDCIHRLFEYGHLGAAGEATDVVLDMREGTMDEIVAIVCGCLEVKEEEVYLRMVQTLLTAATSTKTGLHHGTLLAAVRTIYNIYLNAKMPGTRTTARVSLTQILTLVFARMEAESSEGVVPAQGVDRTAVGSESRSPLNGKRNTIALNREISNTSEPGETIKDGPSTSSLVHGDGLPPGTDFVSILQKDGYLLFRALCKLSAKDLPEDAPQDSVNLRSKLLSLELLRGLVGSSGPVFRSGDRFIYALRHYLAPSLLTNCLSNSMQVVDVSLDIFEMLLRKDTLRPLLKTEIGSLFNTVIFRFLESATAGLARRYRALGLLNRLAMDRQTLADLFLNYDCDMDSSKVFERIVSVLASSAESKPSTHSALSIVGAADSAVGVLQEEELRMSALSSIVHIVTSLRDWSKPIEDGKVGLMPGGGIKHPSAIANGSGTAGDGPLLIADDVIVFRPDSGRTAESGADAPSSSVEPEPSRNGENPPATGLEADLKRSDSPDSERVYRKDRPSIGNGAEGDEVSISLTSSTENVRIDKRESLQSHPNSHVTGNILGTVSEGSDRDTSRFEEALRAKRVMEEGLTLFNAKPRKGVEFLITHGRLKKDPEAVARFFVRTEKLDATMVGEYLGESDAFCVSVMHSYTDLKDMTGLTFDDALRAYLSGFRLPGESQKIDRILEKFASRYCECNPGNFANAEAAFILAYSTIMLHTDAHNPMVKKKMTKEEFIRNNRGINDNADLPYDLLSDLYDRTTTTEIRLDGSLKDSAYETAAAAMGGSAVAAAVTGPAERARRFKEESDELTAKTKILFASRRKTTEDYTYFSATNLYHARLMFEAAWCPVLAALSVLLERAPPSDSTTIVLCLEGFRNSIAIASTFDMKTTKDAFVSSLAKFTHLNSVSEMRAKNVECVRMILAIAAMEGNNLGDTWEVIVRAISQIEQIRAVAAGNPRKYILQKSQLEAIPFPSARRHSGSDPTSIGPDMQPHVRSPAVRSPGSATRGLIGNGTASLLANGSPSSQDPKLNGRGHALSSPGHGGNTVLSMNSAGITGGNANPADSALMQVDAKAATVASMIDESEIERIFVNSSQLSASGVADFCGALCTVSMEELREPTGPRLFCLQKIVEMAYYNMESRTRIQWAKIWEQMGPFFGSAMCHENRDVAMYSIDALRQLSSKFLEKDELSNFSFQRSFLKPFEVCFGCSKYVPVRELVLTCISQIVQARAANIKSGWKSVFSVLALAADDKSESVMNFGFQIVDSIVNRYFGVIDDVFIDAVNGISAYTRSQLSSSVALSAIEMLSGKCASSLAEGKAFAAARPIFETVGSAKSSKIEELVGGSDNAKARHDSTARRSQHFFTADVEAHIGAWFPILTGLAATIQAERPAVRMAASDGLFKVLGEYGGLFAPSMWVLVFRGVLSPLFDDVRHLSSSSDRLEASTVADWAASTGSAALGLMTGCIVEHLDKTRILMPDLLDLLSDWITRENEVVAREGMSALTLFVKGAGDLMTAQDWDIVVDAIQELFERTMPHEILGPNAAGSRMGKERVASPTGEEFDATTNAKMQVEDAESPNGKAETSDMASPADPDVVSRSSLSTNEKKIDFRVVRAKCVVQLLLIQLVQDCVVSFYCDLSTTSIMRLASGVERSYTFARDFNLDIELRRQLYLSGFMNQIPNLLKQETTGLTVYLRIIFWLYLDFAKQGDIATEPKLMALCSRVLAGFITACDEARVKLEERREVAALIPVITIILNGMMQMSNAQFSKHLPLMYDVLLRVVERSDERLVRASVANLFRARINPVAHLQDGDGIGSVQFNPKPQIPGRVRERTFYIGGLNNNNEVALEIQSVLIKVSGVRSAFVDSSDGTARVSASSPDEMLVSSIAGVRKVTDVVLAGDGAEIESVRVAMAL